MCAWVRPLVRAPRGAGAGAGRVTVGAPASVDATNLDARLVLYLQPGAADLTSGGWSRPIRRTRILKREDKRWTGRSSARCPLTQSTRSSTWPDSVRGEVAQRLETDASKPKGADPGRLCSLSFQPGPWLEAERR